MLKIYCFFALVRMLLYLIFQNSSTMKKYSDIIFINLIYLVIGIALFYFLDKQIEILVAVIATGISLALGIRQYKTENDKLFKQLFQEFNTEYDTKFRKKLSEIRKQNKIEDTDIVIDYFNFCAQEYLWKTKGRIPDNVWNSWEQGIVFFISNPLIEEIFIGEKEQRNSYYGWHERTEKKLLLLIKSKKT